LYARLDVTIMTVSALFPVATLLVMSMRYPWFAPDTNSAPYAREPSGRRTGSALAFTPLSTCRAEPPGGAVARSLLKAD
jgi:hypothetical protein